ncbi:MAG: ATP-binding protein [Lyngbya sp. HA4199-MV5]|jgi:hypothetical protein|nr:ATP-binding protein [Lyngbya sp. HA4199-MV5]
MPDSLLTEFQTAYRNLELGPLLDQKDLDRFHVDYSEDTIAGLVQLIEDTSSVASKVIFSGHRGCGKSTLLAEFSRSPLLGNHYFAVMFSIAATVENSDVDHVNILFAIALNLMIEAEKHEVAIPKATQAVIYKWFAEQTQTDTKELKGEASFGIDLLKAVTLKLQTNAGVRREIKQKFERNASELVGQLNVIAATIQAATKKTILVIIDDLDKLELAVVRPIFRDNVKTLCLPGFHIIYTIPMATLRDGEIRTVVRTETNNQIEQMPVLKLFSREESHNPDAVPNVAMMNVLCEVLHKRIPDRLLDRATAETLIRYSGGVLREIIRIANECCRICLRQVRREPENAAIIINDRILEEAVNNIRNDFALTIGKVGYEILFKVYQDFEPDDPLQREFLDLLHELTLLEYRNHKVWYDVHPIVVELLSDRGYDLNAH